MSKEVATPSKQAEGVRPTEAAKRVTKERKFRRVHKDGLPVFQCCQRAECEGKVLDERIYPNPLCNQGGFCLNRRFISRRLDGTLGVEAPGPF